jgi:hypothetical protein
MGFYIDRDPDQYPLGFFRVYYALREGFRRDPAAKKIVEIMEGRYDRTDKQQAYYLRMKAFRLSIRNRPAHDLHTFMMDYHFQTRKILCDDGSGFALEVTARPKLGFSAGFEESLKAQLKNS